MFTDGKWRFLVRSWRYRDGINSNRTSVRSNRNQLQRANSTERNLSPGLPLPHPPIPRLAPRVRYPAIMQHEELPCRLTQQRNGSAQTREKKKEAKVTQNGTSDVASRRVVSCRVVSSRRVGETRWIRIEEVMCKLAMLEFLSSDFSSSHPPIERTSLFWR